MRRKHYLMPRPMRRGQPVLTFVVNEDNSYWLGVYSDLDESITYSPYKGQGTEYNQSTRQRIDKPLYDAFIKQADDIKERLHRIRGSLRDCHYQKLKRVKQRTHPSSKHEERQTEKT